MTDGQSIIEPAALAAIVLDPSRRRRAVSPDLLPMLARVSCALVGLALPALGITLADTVHRVGEPGATQAAAPGHPFGRGGGTSNRRSARPGPGEPAGPRA